MCGRFAQSQIREEYPGCLAEESECDLPFNPYHDNVAPDTKVLLLGSRHRLKWAGDLI